MKFNDKKQEDKISIILGSSSERRKMILSFFFEKFDVINPQCNEKIFDNPKITALENAKIKMFSILNTIDENIKKKFKTLIITADTIVYKDGKIYSKPKSKEDSLYMLKELNGKKHSVFTGVYLYFNDKFYFFHEKTDVYFNFFSDNLLKKYIDTNEPLDAAGSYKIQGSGSILTKRINGSLTNVIGFPIEKFLKYYNRFIC